MTAHEHRPDDARPTHGPGLWIGLAVGLPLVAYGLRGVATDLSGVQLTSFLRYSVGAAVIHDLVVAPAVCVIGHVLARRLPATLLGPVQGALLASALLALVSFPLVRRYGATPGEPSFLAHDYTASLLVSWAVVWTLAGSVALRRVVNARRR